MTGKDTAEPMNREIIEEKDQFLLRRSREILQNRKMLRKEERIRKKESIMKPVWQRPGFWLLMLCAGGIMTGLMIFRKPSPMVASCNSEQGIEAAVEESKVMVATTFADPALSDTEETAPVQALAIVQPEIEAVSQQDAALVVEEILIPEVSAETRDRVQPGPTEQTRIPSDIQISEIVSCSSIIKRQYGAPQKVFCLNQDATVTIWMNVVSDEQPFTLTHVYYVNGSRYCEVPLEIRYKSMRTWSNVSLGRQAHIGEWRVEVITDKGEKLDQIEFTVLP
jgi:hypothetical protein